MPIIKSAKKRARQSIVRRARNNTLKKNLKKSQKRLHAAILNKSKTGTNDNLRQYQSMLDTAVKKNYIHRKKAARRLSVAMLRAKGLIEPGTGKSAKPKAKQSPVKKATKLVAEKTAKKVAKKAKPAKKTVKK
jgi:small subunit ribosomal protein S20